MRKDSGQHFWEPEGEHWGTADCGEGSDNALTEKEGKVEVVAS